MAAHRKFTPNHIGIFTGGSFIARHGSRLNRRNKFIGSTQFGQKLNSPAGEIDSDTKPPFSNNLRPALKALAEVDTATNPGVNHPIFRIGVKTPTGNLAARQFSPRSGDGKFNRFVKYARIRRRSIFDRRKIALKSPTGVMRRIISNNDGAATSTPI